jgi:hypothetical protein
LAASGCALAPGEDGQRRCSWAAGIIVMLFMSLVRRRR